MDKQQWYTELEQVVKSHNQTACNLKEWKSWDDWGEYFRQNMSITDAYKKSVERNPVTESGTLFGEGIISTSLTSHAP
jgi:hypothetical protein